MQISILNGIFTDNDSDFRTSYPHNLIPVPKEQGLSKGYLRPADGIVELGTGPGKDRGAINWNDICYRVMGTSLVSVAADGTVTTIGIITGTDQVTLDYSFDYLAIAADGKLYLYDGATLAQNVDPDLLTVLDMVWVDGYFMTTDGEFLVVTELTDPFQVNPLKYGSAEADPDPIKALLKIRNEVYALNRYTVELFDNIGGNLFPFQRVESAQIEKGCVGTHAASVFMDLLAFVGGGRNEAPAIYIALNATTTKISTREIDQILLTYTEAQLASIVLEERVDKGHEHLLVRLPDQTLVYDGNASGVVEEPVWFVLKSSLTGLASYRATNLVWVYDKWIVGDSTSDKVGFLTDSISSHYGEEIGWEFGTAIAYNEGRNLIFHEIELVCLTGRAALGDDPVIWTQYSVDGVTWSMPKARKVGKIGERLKRIVWFQQGVTRHWRVQRFFGTSKGHLSVARLEVQVEGLN